MTRSAGRIESRPLALPRKAALVIEVLSAYGEARRELRRVGLVAAVAALRAVEVEPDGLTPTRLARVVRRTLSPLPVDSRCLMQTLVLTRLLARRGVAGTVILSVSPKPEFAAHAWIEHEGRALLPPADHGFERLLELGPG
jgi:hypothetical protein